MAETTEFRKRIRDIVAGIAGIENVVNGRVNGGSPNMDIVCAWPEGWLPVEENRQFRRFAVGVKILLEMPDDGQPFDDDDPDSLEALAEDVLAALPAGLLTDDVGTPRWYFQLEGVGFEVDERAVEFAFVVQLDNENEV